MTRKASIQNIFIGYMLLSTFVVMAIAYGLSYAVQGRIMKVVLPAESVAITELSTAQIEPSQNQVNALSTTPAIVQPTTVAIVATKINDNVQLVKTNTITEYQKNFLLIFTVLLLVQLLIALKFIQKTLLVPLHESTEAINRLASGYYDLPQAEASPNELKQLHHQLYKLSEELLLAKAFKESSEFQRKSLIAGISHDLKTPLTNIKGYAETLLMDNQLTEEQNSFLGVILRSTDVANNLINDLSDMNRLDLMQYPLRLELVDIQHLIETCVHDVAYSLPSTHQHIHFKESSEPLMCHGDAMLFQRLFKNLISNFQKHAGNGTVLTIDWQTTSSGYLITFSDNGIGVEPSELNKLTDMFYMSDQARTKRGNSGLGLYNCLQITNLLGAELTFESQKSKGLTVLIQLKA